jgi:hypothetical protein
MAGTKGTKHLTIGQIAKAYALLSEHCKKLDSGYAQYEPGWNDDVIATQLGVHKSGVARVRLQEFGKLFDRGEAKAPTVEAQLAELKQRIEGQEAFSLRAVAELTRKHNELVDALKSLFDKATVTKLKIAEDLRVDA